MLGIRSDLEGLEVSYQRPLRLVPRGEAVRGLGGVRGVPVGVGTAGCGEVP